MIIIIIIIIIIMIMIIHNGNRSVCLMHFSPSYKRLWARWRGLALKVNYNVSKNAIYKVQHSEGRDEGEKKKTAFMYTSIYFLSLYGI